MSIKLEQEQQEEYSLNNYSEMKSTQNKELKRIEFPMIEQIRTN